MMKKNDKRRRKKKTSPRPSVPDESRAAEAVTVAWLLASMMNLLCLAVSVIARVVVMGQEDPRQTLLLANLLLFAAGVMGAASLLLLPAVRKLRDVPPPRRLQQWTAATALIPILGLLIITMS